MRSGLALVFSQYAVNSAGVTSTIFTACRRIGPSPRGELEIQSAVALAMRNMGERFEVVTARSGVLDLSSRADVAFVVRALESVEPRP